VSVVGTIGSCGGFCGAQTFREATGAAAAAEAMVVLEEENKLPYVVALLLLPLPFNPPNCNDAVPPFMVACSAGLLLAVVRSPEMRRSLMCRMDEPPARAAAGGGDAVSSSSGAAALKGLKGDQLHLRVFPLSPVAGVRPMACKVI